DFALVRFKKLSGGGYFKIINQSVPAALRNLGYAENQIEEMVRYAKGAGTIKGAPHLNPEKLFSLGFSVTEVTRIDKAAVAAFDIRFLFLPHLLDKDFCTRLDIPHEAIKQPGFDLLAALGLTEIQIADLNDYVCGTMTLEGAPHLKSEHLPVFD